MFRKLSSSVGSGKTQAVLEHIRDNLGAGFLYVAPTIALCEEVHARLLKTLVDHQEYCDENHLKLVVSDGDSGPVFPRALDACQNIQASQPPIVIVTTKTFEFLMANLHDLYKARFHVFVDEGLPAIKQESFSPGDPSEFLGYFAQDADGYVQPGEGKRQILEWVAYSPNKLSGQQLDHLNIPHVRNICELSVSGNYDVFVTKTERSIQAIGLLSPEPLRAFKSVTLIVAIFERTLLPLLWMKRHSIEFEDFPLPEPLHDTHTVKGPLISIRHVTCSPRNPSL